MKLVRVMALKDHEWKGIPRTDKEIYTVDSEDIRFGALLAMGLAKMVDTIDTQEPQPAPAGRYNRRDLRAKR